MRWRVHAERSLYSDPWIDLRVADVELPDGRHLEHRLFRFLPGLA
jgi:ADP-ribose diphosphatase